MKVSGELHVPSALLLEPAIPFIWRVAGLIAVLDTRKVKSLVPVCYRIKIPRTFSQ